MQSHYWRFFTRSKTDRYLLRQKFRQRISVVKTKTGVFVVFKIKLKTKCMVTLWLYLKVF